MMALEQSDYPHIDIYCSPLFNLHELEEGGVPMTPLSVNELNGKNDIVYFYHPEEEADLERIQREDKDIYFSSYEQEKSREFLATINRLVFERKLMDQLLINIDEFHQNEKKLTHLLKRENRQQNDIHLEHLLKNDSTLFHDVDLEDLLQGIRKQYGKKIKSLFVSPLEETSDINSHLYPIFIGKKVFVLFLEFKKIDEHEEIFLKSFIYHWVNRFFSLTKECDADSAGNSLWEKIFSIIPLPMTLISNDGEILLYNKKFMEMEITPSRCLEVKDGDRIQNRNQSYLVDRFDLQQSGSDTSEEVFLYIFRTIGDQVATDESNKLQKISSKELGIISSSMAHELNNPLGGVMAAISLLELDMIKEDNKQHLSEMKESAKRCRDLIDIFLGFSKVAKNIPKSCTVLEALKQSLDMLRFRMIESNLIFELSHDTQDKFQQNVNFSTATMLFYLIFGEILTSVHHDMLISSNKSDHIKVDYLEKEKGITIHFDRKIQLHKNIMDSKLLNFLIDTENLNIDIKNDAIQITEWKLT